MKRVYGALMSAGIVLLTLSAVLPHQDLLIWNRTASAPLGLYWRSDAPVSRGSWGVVSRQNASAKWVAARGYIGDDWPLIKRVAALSGDEICRFDTRIFINKLEVARTHASSDFGHDLPVWQGCLTLKQDQMFLLNDHPNSLDGRYFGPAPIEDIVGSAHLIWEYKR